MGIMVTNAAHSDRMVPVTAALSRGLSFDKLRQSSSYLLRSDAMNQLDALKRFTTVVAMATEKLAEGLCAFALEAGKLEQLVLAG